MRLVSGKVEEGRGSFGHGGIAPFPFPAHQTGRAVCPHPAFRIASLQGARRGAKMDTPKPQDSERAEYRLRGEAVGASRRHLVTPNQEVPDPVIDVVVDRPIRPVWGMLRNPAYKGAACFGKTGAAPRQRVTRPLRLRGGLAARNSANHERPRGHWIEIPVPAIIDDATFALTQELLEANKTHAPRRTAEPSVVQGLVSCSKCGYALYRTSTRSSARKIHYYRCLGSDTWRHFGRSVCDNRPVRQDLLDRIVWTEIIRLLEDPSLIQRELDRRLAAARASSPTKRREEILQRDLVRAPKEHGPSADGLPGGLDLARRAPPQDAGVAAARACHAGRIAVDPGPGERSRCLPASRRDVIGVPDPAAVVSRDRTGPGAAAGRAAAGQGNPGRRRHNHHSTLDPATAQPLRRQVAPISGP